MRPSLVIVAGAVIGVLAATMTAVATSKSSTRETTSEAAIVATGTAGATASRADGSTRVELPWLRPGDSDISIAPNGREIAFSSTRDGSAEIYVVDARTGELRRLTDNPGAEDVDPAWSPDGRTIAWASGRAKAHRLFVMDENGGRKRSLADPEARDDIEPAWSPDGSQIAFASNRGGRYQVWTTSRAGGSAALLVEGRGDLRLPAWSPSGASIAYTQAVGGNADVWVAEPDTSSTRRVTTAARYDGRATWSPDGGRLAFVSTRGGRQRIWLMSADGTTQRPLSTSQAGDDRPVWRLVEDSISPERGTLLPDLDQQAPSGILVLRTNGRVRLGFTSAVDNIGDGPIHIQGTRFGAAPRMRADQLIHHRGGKLTRVEGIGRLAYEAHPPHYHWHLEPYETYELRRAGDDTFVARDGKSGFCLLDRWGHALKRPGLVPAPPRFVGDCAARQPEARRVDEGSSVGYTDRYPGFFHGQDIDIDGLAPGLYVLVHRANPALRIRELRYSNDAASALIRISAVSPLTAVPTVTVLRRCPGSDRCTPA